MVRKLDKLFVAIKISQIKHYKGFYILKMIGVMVSWPLPVCVL